MKNELYKSVQELFELLIDTTKTNSALWNNIKDLMQNVEISSLINKFQQKQMLDSLVMFSEKSSYVKINNTYFVCFCFKNIIAETTVYKVVMLSGQPFKIIELSQYDEENFSSRLANIIRFQSMKPEDIETEDDLEFIKSIISELQNN